MSLSLAAVQACQKQSLCVALFLTDTPPIRFVSKNQEYQIGRLAVAPAKLYEIKNLP
jgi:hypothetical protein